MENLGKGLMAKGLSVAALRPGIRLGRLPGSVVVCRGEFTLVAPVATTLLASLPPSGALWLLVAVPR